MAHLAGYRLRGRHTWSNARTPDAPGRSHRLGHLARLHPRGNLPGEHAADSVGLGGLRRVGGWPHCWRTGRRHPLHGLRVRCDPKAHERRGRRTTQAVDDGAPEAPRGAERHRRLKTQPRTTHYAPFQAHSLQQWSAWEGRFTFNRKLMFTNP